MIATTDPATLPDLTTSYLVTNLPVAGAQRTADSELAAASLTGVLRLYGLRMWVEQSYKQVKYALGWSEYQVRSDCAMRRHWQLVCCAFSFCWYHLAHPAPIAPPAGAIPETSLTERAQTAAPQAQRSGEKKEAEASERPHISWPKALRAMRAWLEPWVLLRRYWRAWSALPPPPLLQCLFEQLGRGQGLFLYGTF